MISIDGSHGEGGGQVLRTSLGLSAIHGTEIEIGNIRSNRPNPGLRPQHLATLEAFRKITKGRLTGGGIGAMEVRFRPSGIYSGKYEFDIGTAGSTTLMLHALLLPLLFADGPSDIRIRGGTDVPWSPTVDYYGNVTLKALEMMGVRTKLEVLRRGYYPKGGGLVSLHVEPWADRAPLSSAGVGEPSRIFLSSCSAGLGEDVASRQIAGAVGVLNTENTSTSIDRGGFGVGSSLTLWARAGDLPIGFSSLGKKGLLAEEVGSRAASGLLDIIRSGSVDRHLPDQIVPFLSLIGSESILPAPMLTGHLATNLDVINLFGNVPWSYDGKKVIIKGKIKED